MKTDYPSLAVKDDWNDRTPPAVTSLADDVKKATKKPNPAAYHELDPKTAVETSFGLVAADTNTAKAALDVTMRDTDGTTVEPGDSGATMPTATLGVQRTTVANTGGETAGSDTSSTSGS